MAKKLKLEITDIEQKREVRPVYVTGNPFPVDFEVVPGSTRTTIHLELKKEEDGQ